MTRPTKTKGDAPMAKGENWVILKSKKSVHAQDIETMQKAQQKRLRYLEENQLEEVWVKNPDLKQPRCWIRKLIKRV